MARLKDFITRYFKNEKLMVYEQDGDNCELLTPELVESSNYNDFDIIEIKYEKHFDCITIYLKKKEDAFGKYVVKPTPNKKICKY